jgi:hypothetical protein
MQNNTKPGIPRQFACRLAFLPDQRQHRTDEGNSGAADWSQRVQNADVTFRFLPESEVMLDILLGRVGDEHRERGQR